MQGGATRARLRDIEFCSILTRINHNTITANRFDDLSRVKYFIHDEEHTLPLRKIYNNLLCIQKKEKERKIVVNMIGFFFIERIHVCVLCVCKLSIRITLVYFNIIWKIKNVDVFNIYYLKTFNDQ